MTEILIMVKSKGELSKQKVVFTEVLLRTGWSTDRDSSCGKMEENTGENGDRVKRMERGNSTIQKEKW